VCEQCARSRRRVRQTTVGRRFRLGRRDETETQHLEAELGAHALQEGNVAVAPVAEVEVGADDHQPRPEHARQQLGDEVFGRLLAARLVERQDEALVDRSGRFEQLQLLLQCRQQLGRGSRSDHLRRMTVEREHGRGQSARSRKIAHETEHGLVPEVDAVERADGNRSPTGARAVKRPDLAGIAPDDHSGSWHSGSWHSGPWPSGPWHFDSRTGESWGARTTAGFTPAPRRS